MRKSTLIWLGLTIFCGAALFYTTQEVTDGRQQLAKLQKNIQEEEETLRVLQAEWSYLNQPERLEKLARQHLSLQPMKPRQFVRIENLDKMEMPSAETIAEVKEEAIKEETKVIAAADAEKTENIAAVVPEPAPAPEKAKPATAKAVSPKKPQQPPLSTAAKKPTAKSPETQASKRPAPQPPAAKPVAQQADNRDFNAVMQSLGVR